MAKSSLCFVLLFFSLTACRNQPSSDTDGVKTDIAEIKADTLFDLQKYKEYFRFKNNLVAIPFIGNDPSDTTFQFVLDTILLKTVYQDSINHYFPSEVGGGGNQFYGYIDTFKNFNLICMLTGRGDAGDVYDLLTYSKSGKCIASLRAVWLQGEEDVWDYNQTARLVGDKIDITATACRYTDTTGATKACDTIRRFYKVQENGKISLLKEDSVLNPALDSLRMALPYN